MSPGGEMNASPVVEPRINRFFQTLPGLLLFQPIFSPRGRSARRSTVPSIPNVGMDSPVRASTACRKLSIENSSRRSLPSVTLPVIDAAAGDPIQPLMDPDFFAGGRIERDERTVAAET